MSDIILYHTNVERFQRLEGIRYTHVSTTGAGDCYVGDYTVNECLDGSDVDVASSSVRGEGVVLYELI